MLDLYPASLGRSAVPLTCRREQSDHFQGTQLYTSYDTACQVHTFLLMDLCLNWVFSFLVLVLASIRNGAPAAQQHVSLQVQLHWHDVACPPCTP